jgi:ketosteroid isomerase-like protein
MKKNYNVFLLLIASVFFVLSCNPKTDVEKEKEAIKAVIHAETQAFYDKNSIAFKDLYIQDENQTRVMFSGSDLSITKGWNQLKIMADSIPYFDWSEQKNFKFTQDIVSIKVIGNVAWVILKYQSSYSYKGADTKDNDLQTIVLEKLDGKWKISCFVILQIPHPISQVQ